MKQHSVIRVLSWFFCGVNRFIPWHRLPWPIGILNLISFRNQLRVDNLYDTETDEEAKLPVCPERWKTARSDDGSYNDLSRPSMGCAGAHFGRNSDRSHSIPDDDEVTSTPNPRVISERLMKRDKFLPIPFLNMHTASWIQFQVHGWLNHERVYDEHYEVPLADDDQWHENPMRFRKLKRDKIIKGGIPTYRNTESHWWDGSNIYGSSLEVQQRLRTGENGKLKVDERGLLPADPNPSFADPTGQGGGCLLYTSPSPRDRTRSRMPSSA